MLFGRYRFACRFIEEAYLPSYKGSTFRGAFGGALKKVVCAVRKKDCTSCLLAGRCVYARVFETAAVPTQPARQAAPPHPYVIEPTLEGKTRYVAGDAFDFTLLLFGEFNDYLPYFVYAFETMGEQGLGRHRRQGLGRYRVEGVTGNGQALYDAERRQLGPQRPTLLSVSSGEAGSGTLHLRLLTPLRLKFDNQLQARLPFHLLIRAVLRRVSALFAAFADGEPELDYRGLVARAQAVEVVASQLNWCDWQRYSNRQEQAMLMGGMNGEITYRGNIGEYLPLLELARELHLGKQSSFGLGRMDFEWRGDP